MAGRQQQGVDSGPQWPVTAMVLGVLLFVILFWTLGQLTLIRIRDLFRWFALFAFAGNLLPPRCYAKRLVMDRMEWFWFNLLAVGPFLFAAGLVLNYTVHGPEQKMVVQSGRDFDLHDYWLRNQALPPHLPWPGDFGSNPEKDRAALRTVRADDQVYGLAQGLFGYFVITAQDEAGQLARPAE